MQSYSYNIKSVILPSENLYPLENIPFEKLPEEEKECLICYGEFELSSPILQHTTKTESGTQLHFFHSSCIEVWRLEHDTCPKCIKLIKSSENEESRIFKLIATGSYFLGNYKQRFQSDMAAIATLGEKNSFFDSLKEKKILYLKNDHFQTYQMHGSFLNLGFLVASIMGTVAVLKGEVNLFKEAKKRYKEVENLIERPMGSSKRNEKRFLDILMENALQFAHQFEGSKENKKVKEQICANFLALENASSLKIDLLKYLERNDLNGSATYQTLVKDPEIVDFLKKEELKKQEFYSKIKKRIFIKKLTNVALFTLTLIGISALGLWYKNKEFN